MRLRTIITIVKVMTKLKKKLLYKISFREK
jgi:hypothetical protein